ncbi:MAG: phosphoglycerate dehydrogenase [Minisyncoccia bacterium]|jgi:D-3-phosphoglycerate dehydrogenase
MEGTNGTAKKTSYPKSKIKVLLLENIHADAAKTFSAEGYPVKTADRALDEADLVKELADVRILGIRSKTKITGHILAAAPRLLAIGAFCIGTNQIDFAECDKRGVAVFNAPYANSRSVVELALGEILMLLRKVFDKSVQLHAGTWNKSASGSFEARGKRLGIVGYGNIGSQLSVLAEALGMEVYFYDIEEKLALGNAKRCKTLAELLRKSDVVSLHVDGRAENKNLIGEKELARMRPGSYLVNISRGHVVNLDALARHLTAGHLAGAAVDVFPEEPKGNADPFTSPLQGLPNVILTPHIGGSTEEAQKNIAGYVAGRVIDYVNTGDTSMSVNFPNVRLPLLKKAHRIIHIHENIPGMLARVNEIFAAHKINIVGQYLKTTETIGYTITDIESTHGNEVIAALKAVPHTIKARILY